MKKISLSKVNEFFAEVAKAQKLYLPVEQEDKTSRFEEWAEDKTVSLLGNTVRSAKFLLSPDGKHGGF